MIEQNYIALYARMRGLILFLVFFLACSVQSKNKSIEEIIADINKKFEAGYYSRVQSEVEKTLPSLSKASVFRKQLLEIYAKALEELGQYEKSAQTLLQLVDEYPLDESQRDWMLNACKNLLKTRSRIDTDITPVEKVVKILDEIKHKWGELSEEEHQILQEAKSQLKQYYLKVKNFYERMNLKQAAAVYINKINELE